MSSFLSKSEARRQSVDGQRAFYCFLCGLEHISVRQLTADTSLLDEMRRRWPTESDRLDQLRSVKKLQFCCAWLVQGHRRRVRHVQPSLAESPPNRANLQTRVRAMSATKRAASAAGGDDGDEPSVPNADNGQDVSARDEEGTSTQSPALWCALRPNRDFAVNRRRKKMDVRRRSVVLKAANDVLSSDSIRLREELAVASRKVAELEASLRLGTNVSLASCALVCASFMSPSPQAFSYERILRSKSLRLMCNVSEAEQGVHAWAKEAARSRKHTGGVVCDSFQRN